MAFINKNFSPIGGQARSGDSPGHWSYQSSIDDLDAVRAPGYFDEIATQIVAGDFINVSLTDGKSIITVASTTDFPKQVVIDLFTISAGGAFPVEVFTGTVKNLVVSDNFKFFVMDADSLQVIVIPLNSSEPFPIGAEMDFIREGTGAATFIINSPAVLQSRDGLVDINAQYSAVTLKKVGTDEWRLFGDLA